MLYLSRIESYVADMPIWMNDNFFKLNDDKTKLLIIITREDFSKILDISIQVGEQTISPSDDPQKKLRCDFQFYMVCWCIHCKIM